MCSCKIRVDGRTCRRLVTSNNVTLHPATALVLQNHVSNPSKPQIASSICATSILLYPGGTFVMHARTTAGVAAAVLSFPASPVYLYTSTCRRMTRAAAAAYVICVTRSISSSWCNSSNSSKWCYESSKSSRPVIVVYQRAAPMSCSCSRLRASLRGTPLFTAAHAVAAAVQLPSIA